MNYELGVIHNSLAAVLTRRGKRRELPRISTQSSLGVPRALVQDPQGYQNLPMLKSLI